MGGKGFMALHSKLVAISLTSLAIFMAACGPLPRGAALEREVLAVSDDETAEFAVYQVTRDFLPVVETWPSLGPHHRHWLRHSHGPEAQVIRPGDSLDIAIWDSNENSLVTAPNQRVVEMPGVRVSSSGQVFLPYIDPIRVADVTPAAARARLETALQRIAPDAQVQLRMTEGRGNAVDLVGGVKAPGSYPMLGQNYSVLNLIAAGGGVSPALENPQVRLRRGHHGYVTSLDRLYQDPSRDTRLAPGDQVVIESDPRYFLSLGATGTEAQHPFNRETVSAMDALALIGGVNDARADPQGLLILREYPAKAVRDGVKGPEQTRVVFAVDLTTADGLFSARKFAIQNEDLIFATESPVTGVQTILDLVGTAFGVARSAAE